MSTYTVKKGDTLSKIAKDKGVTVDAIMKANPKIKDKNNIKVGQVIQIPAKKNTETKTKDYKKIGQQLEKCVSDIACLPSVNDLMEML